MIRKYPKPVICYDFIENSFYKGNYKFELKLDEEKQIITSDSVQLNFSCELNSDVLNSLIKDNKVSAFYKIKTNHFSKMFEFDINNDNISYALEKNALEKTDKITVTLYLIATTDFEMTNNEELIDEVKNFKFTYKKNELLGISNSEKLNYSVSGKPFINISLAEQQENKGLLFSSLDKQVIQIKVGPSWNEAYAKLLQNKIASEVMSPFLAFSAILYALEKAIQDKDNSSFDKDWYKMIDQNFASDKYDDLEDFIESMRSDFDIDAIFAVVQGILNNSLESRIIRASRRAR